MYSDNASAGNPGVVYQNAAGKLLFANKGMTAQYTRCSGN
jgi:hypothetical protein